MGDERRFRREGTYVYLWLIPVAVWQKPEQESNDLPIKNLKKKERVSQERGRGKNPQMQEREENPQSDGEGIPWTTAALDSNQFSLEQDKNWKIFLLKEK